MDGRPSSGDDDLGVILGGRIYLLLFLFPSWSVGRRHLSGDGLELVGGKEGSFSRRDLRFSVDGKVVRAKLLLQVYERSRQWRISDTNRDVYRFTWTLFQI